jgi:hypothetical protein
MKLPLDMSLRKGILLFLCAFLLPSLLCIGQTNSAHAAAAPRHLAPTDVSWQNAASAYYLDLAKPTPTPQAQQEKPPNTPANPATPAPDQPGGSRQMNLETANAQYARIEAEGLLQTRAAARQAQRNLFLETQMGALCHDPRYICLGTPLNQIRLLPSATAAGVP